MQRCRLQPCLFRNRCCVSDQTAPSRVLDISGKLQVKHASRNGLSGLNVHDPEVQHDLGKPMTKIVSSKEKCF